MRMARRQEGGKKGRNEADRIERERVRLSETSVAIESQEKRGNVDEKSESNSIPPEKMEKQLPCLR